MNDAALSLRLCEPSDFESLYAMDQDCFPSGIAYERDELSFYLAARGSHCVVAVWGGEISGFVLTERSGRVCHVVTLDVLPRFRRRSVGSLLLAAAEQHAAEQGATAVYLETATANTSAIALWTKHGYRKLGVLADYYGPGLDAFEMLKRLGRSGGREPDPILEPL